MMKTSAKNICSAFGGGVTPRTLSAMALAGVLAFGTQAFAMDINEAMKTKPVDTPTLEYLKTNEVLVPQKGVYDKTNETWAEAEPVKLEKGSAYTVEEINSLSGDENTAEFKYTTVDKDGNLIDTYYKINYDVKTPEDYKVPEDYNPSDYSTVYDNQATVEYWRTGYKDKHYYGGAVKVKEGEATSITDTLFVNNKSEVIESSNSNYVYGGALCNTGIVNELVADFINNSANATGSSSSSYSYSSAFGGAIDNYGGTIGNIVGDFVNNSATSTSDDAQGGAIDNRGTIGNITGDFINNSVTGSRAFGGAIYNSGTIGNITGNFINNSANTIGNYANTVASGGAIYNGVNGYGNAIIGDITGNFINNSAKDSGGAIYNSYATIGNITGNFINNSATSTSYYAEGGAIYNFYGTIGDIVGNFINNSASSGGAIYNDRGRIGNITGDFINNLGGAIYNRYYKDEYGIIGNITGDFINNSGGAISGGGTIGNITGNFINNSGGAIYNSNNTIGNIVGDFINNSVTSTSGSASGGAIYNSRGTIGNITGDFINNSANGTFNANGGAIYNNYGTIGNITGNFINNSANSSSSADGGAIYNRDGNIGNIVGNFINNSANSTYGNASGGAIYNYARSLSSKETIDNIVGNFINNSATSTNSSAYGGAVYNNSELEFVNLNFIDNYAKTENANAKAQGGAIYSTRLMNITADNGVSEFTGNYVQIGNEKNYQAIYIPGLNFNAKNSGKIVMNDKMTFSLDGLREELNAAVGSYAIYQSSDHYEFIVLKDQEVLDNLKQELHLQLNIDGDDTGLVQINNDVEAEIIEQSAVQVITSDKLISHGTSGYTIVDSGDAITTLELASDYLEISLSNTNLHLGVRDNVIDGHNLTLNSGLMSMVNNQAGVSALHKLTIAGDTNFVADVDLANQTMDRFTAEEYGDHTGNLIVTGMNLLSDAKEDKTYVPFAEDGLREHVKTTVKEVSYSPIYKYDVTYRPEDGKFLFARGGAGNPSNNFNPAVLTTSVNTQAASQATVNETFKYVFEHADAFTQMPSYERQAIINADRYALSTDFNHNLGSLCPEHNNKAGWFRPYVTFENMSLRNGPKVDAITYGSLVGFDSDFQHFKKGWTGVTTGYVGYNGSQLSYSGVDTSMNGGLLGLTQTLYKGNFWTALTLSAGASVGESNTMYGKEDFTSLLAGVGSKTGYNFEFKEGKYIIQPIMFMSYTFVNTFDYTNAAGVKINTSPAHSIQLNPSVRFITNTKNGWQPYASVGMVWNVMNENKVTANNVRLPEMSMKPYVEYGLGIQKNWKDNFTAFGQAMIRNGGRNGIAFTAGMRWAIGHNHPEQVHNSAPKVKKVIKQAKI